jgi:hypothetical protein
MSCPRRLKLGEFQFINRFSRFSEGGADGVDDGSAMPSPDVRLESAVNRVLRLWSLIKLVD